MSSLPPSCREDGRLAADLSLSPLPMPSYPVAPVAPPVVIRDKAPENMNLEKDLTKPSMKDSLKMDFKVSQKGDTDEVIRKKAPQDGGRGKTRGVRERLAKDIDVFYRNSEPQDGGNRLYNQNLSWENGEGSRGGNRRHGREGKNQNGGGLWHSYYFRDRRESSALFERSHSTKSPSSGDSTSSPDSSPNPPRWVVSPPSCPSQWVRGVSAVGQPSSNRAPPLHPPTDTTSHKVTAPFTGGGPSPQLCLHPGSHAPSSGSHGSEPGRGRLRPLSCEGMGRPWRLRSPITPRGKTLTGNPFN